MVQNINDWNKYYHIYEEFPYFSDLVVKTVNNVFFNYKINIDVGLFSNLNQYQSIEFFCKKKFNIKTYVSNFGIIQVTKFINLQNDSIFPSYKDIEYKELINLRFNAEQNEFKQFLEYNKRRFFNE